MPSRKKSYRKRGSRKTSKRGSRKTVKRGSRKTSKKRSGSRAKRSSLTKRSCQTKLKNKIRINMSEYKKGRFSSRQQALAVSYAQVNKTGCKRYFKRG
jgi:hypothetical protein